MAATIFNSTNYQSIVQRINRLSIQSQRQWGKMTVSQMLQHCIIQLKIALAISPSPKTQGSAFFRTSIGRWTILYLVPWPKGSATPSDMNMEENGVAVQNFENAGIQLVQLLQQAQQQDSFGIHPFFGTLNKKEWGRLIWKHLDHHLRQFGK
jgi:Protein of unknown function (DUF1569)